MFVSVPCAYVLWAFTGLLGGHRFYLGRPVSGLVWLFTAGLCGFGWIIDAFLLPSFVEEYNKRAFHRSMMETGNSLLFDGELGGGGLGAAYSQQQNQQQFGGVPMLGDQRYFPSPPQQPNTAYYPRPPTGAYY